MNKRKKSGFLLVLFLITALCLGGCTKETAGKAEMLSKEEVITKMKAFMEESDSSKMDMTMEMAAQIKSSGVTLQMEMTMTAQIESRIKEQVSHNNLNMEINVLGQSQEMSNETYSVMEDGILKTYVLQDGEWSYMEGGDEDSANAFSGMTNLSDIVMGDMSDWTLSDQLVKIGDEECYELRFVFKGNSLEGITGMTEALIGGGLNGDLSALELPVTYYAAQEDCRLVKMEADWAEGFSKLFEGTELEGSSFEVMKVIAENMSYNTVDKIEIPAEALQAESGTAGSAGDLDLELDVTDLMQDEYEAITEAGEFVLTAGEAKHQLQIRWPSGYICDYQLSNSLCLYNDELASNAEFSLWEKEYRTAEELDAEVLEMPEFLESLGYYSDINASEMQTKVVGDLTYHYITISSIILAEYPSYSYVGYMELEDSLVWFQLDFESETPQDAVLEEFLANMQEVTGSI